ncbi:MAG: hypothetical protein ACKVKJ_02205 [Fidelibacterota bacterium]|jgi:hypothetical protein|tara:strand:- start:703 stop:1281 length:579 start_codon:yes stop_codon:yes gene_type:complete
MKFFLIFSILFLASIQTQSEKWKKTFINVMNHDDGISINVKIEQLQFDSKSFDSGIIEIMDKDNYILSFPNETVFISQGIIKTWNKVNNQLIIDKLIEGDITIFDLLTGEFKDVSFETPKKIRNLTMVNFNIEMMGYSGYIKTKENGEPVELKVKYGPNQFLLLTVTKYTIGNLKLINRFNPLNAEIIDLRE